MDRKKADLMSGIGQLFLTWRRYLQKQIIPAECTLKQHYLLNRLSKKNFLIPSEIARELFCDRPTASVIIRNLEKKGWVQRKKNPENQKSFRIYITEAGREVLTQTGKLLQTRINPTSCLTEEDQKDLARILEKMRNYFSSQIPQ